MSWFKVDDAWHSHPKVMLAGNAAAGLWARCGSYCSQHNLEGRIPVGIAEAYGSRKEIGDLIRVGLWVRDGDVYVMPDWLDYNPSAESVKAKRKADADRQRRAREAAASRRDTDRDSQRDDPVSHGPPDPTRPDPILVTGSTETTDDLQSVGPSSVVVEVAHHMAELLWAVSGVHPSKHKRWVEATQANIANERALEIEKAYLSYPHLDEKQIADGLINDRWPARLRSVPAAQEPVTERPPPISHAEHVDRLRTRAAAGDDAAAAELAVWERPSAKAFGQAIGGAQ